MKFLIIYTSIEGQTRKIAATMAAHLEDLGHVAALMNVNAAPEFGLEKPDAMIATAPIHAGRYPTPFIDFIHRERDWLNALPSAFVSVTLSIHSDHADERMAAAQFPEALKAETGWRPRATHNAAGALRFTEYDFFKRWMMRRIAEAEGASARGGDVEFTDWAALDAFVETFAAAVAHP